MTKPACTRLFLTLLAALLLISARAVTTPCQEEDGFGYDPDPVKLFERGQSAHARGELEKALEFYDQALKVRPDFPEAEFQRGNALVSLGRLVEAETAFKRAIEQRTNWSLPRSALGALLVRQEKDLEAESAFRQALSIDRHDNLALRMLAELRLRSGDKLEALDLAREATREKEAPSSAWIVRAMAERANGDTPGAKTSLNRVLESEPENLAALIGRADIFIDEADYDKAIADLNKAAGLRPDDKQIFSRLALAHERAGRTGEAQRFARVAGLDPAQEATPGTNAVLGTPDEIEAANSADPGRARKALERLLEKNPRNAQLLANLGSSYRTDDPARSLEFYRRAAEIQPDNADFVVGYASALVQALRFSEAAMILRRVIASDPQNYQAHANLATALYKLKQYAAAIPEYEWLLQARPDLLVSYYFIATSHDYLGEYPEALIAYESFLAGADAERHQLEIEKVKLRLPLLRRQIQLGQGAKRRKP